MTGLKKGIDIDKKETHSYIFLTVAVALNSISGLRYGSLSLNMVWNVVLIGITVCIYLKHRCKCRIQKNSPFFYYIIFCLISCSISYLYPYNSNEQQDTVRSFLINAFFYLIVYVMLCGMSNYAFYKYEIAFRKGIILAARIQGIWGAAQFVLLYTIGFNLNSFVLGDILHISNAENSVWGFWTGTSFSMRITGLTNENSFFAILECCGLIFETNIYWKIFLAGMIALSLSRSGWIMLAIVLLDSAFVALRKKNSKIKMKSIARFVLILAAVLGIILSSKSIQYQIGSILSRINDPASHTESSFRHIMYYPCGFMIWLFESNIFQKLIGYGIRCSGLAFNMSKRYSKVLPFTYGSLNVECDPIGLLLGGGILTLIMYYKSLMKTFFSGFQYRQFALMLLFAGVTYTFHANSYILWILCVSNVLNSKEKAKYI